jgi:hypothetical protein
MVGRKMDFTHAACTAPAPTFEAVSREAGQNVTLSLHQRS